MCLKYILDQKLVSTDVVVTLGMVSKSRVKPRLSGETLLMIIEVFVSEEPIVHQCDFYWTSDAGISIC